jgi:hypothetical protein
VGICAVTEVTAILAFRNIPNDHLFVGLGSKHVIAFIVALPMVAGMNGYYSVRRRLSSASEEVTTVLSRQFLFATITAYVALLFCIGPLAESLRPIVK